MNADWPEAVIEWHAANCRDCRIQRTENLDVVPCAWRRRSCSLWRSPSPRRRRRSGASPPAARLGSPAPLQPGDAFGEEVTLPERTIVYLKGHSNWDAAFDTLVDAFKSLNEYLDKQGIKPTGPAMTIYTQTDDTGFPFEAAMPIAAAPERSAERRHRGRPGAVRQGAQIRPSRLL